MYMHFCYRLCTEEGKQRITPLHAVPVSKVTISQGNVFVHGNGKLCGFMLYLLLSI